MDGSVGHAQRGILTRGEWREEEQGGWVGSDHTPGHLQICFVHVINIDVVLY